MAGDTTPTVDEVFPGKSIAELMDERSDLTMGALLDKLADKLQARETKVFKGKEGDEDILIYSAPLEAHGIQVQALEMALKLRGAFVTKVEHTGKDGGPIETRNESLDAVVAKYLSQSE
ncbi:MAG: hypothetical protein ABFD97_20350 [Syntrophobacter sp.]